jgi:1,4-alpha-glucan branching enzyme
MEQGLLALILHAHLPFVRHPEYPEFLEEDWLFEAISETYIPLLHSFRTLADAGVQFRVTMTLTPPLCEMLADPLLQERYLRHLYRLIELAEKEIVRTKNQPPFDESARMYLDHFRAARAVFEDRYKRNLVTGFKELQDAGFLEIITCGATHGFLPLMHQPQARWAQVEVARRNYHKHLGRAPQGFWLPECAYEPGLEEVLKAADIRYFILDSHGILNGQPRPLRGIYAPVKTPAGVHALARDVETSEQVWSAETGYPGDPFYREFYRDLGYDADHEYIRPYLHRDGVRRNIGIKYYRVTGKVGLDKKEPYVPSIAAERAAEHAGHFMWSRERQAEYLYPLLGRKPMVVSPYDAELFGHWWFEGPRFLDYLIRKIHYDTDLIRLATPMDYLSEHPDNQEQIPAISSWGAEGYYRMWLNGGTEWMYPHQHQSEQRMVGLANQYPEADGLRLRALNQAARELLLAQSSDWAFIISTGTAVTYAIKRFKDHIHRFNRLYEDITSGQIDPQWLADVESKDTIFQEMDYRVYRTDQGL